jgi:hypothetical protein
MTSSVDTLLKIKEYANGMFPDAEGNNDDGDYRIKLINIEDNGLTTLTLTFGVYTKDGDPVIQSKIFARQSVVGNLANILGEIWQRNTKCVITTIGSNGRRPMEFIINQK